MFEPTLRQRLDAAMCVLCSDNDQTYRRALYANTSALNVLRRLFEVTNSRYKAKDYMTLPVSGLISMYYQNYSYAGHRVSHSGHNGTVSIHFLQFALKHLPDGSDLSPSEPLPVELRLPRMIKHAIAIWQEANPGVVPEPATGGSRVGHVI